MRRSDHGAFGHRVLDFENMGLNSPPIEVVRALGNSASATEYADAPRFWHRDVASMLRRRHIGVCFTGCSALCVHQEADYLLQRSKEVKQVP